MKLNPDTLEELLMTRQKSPEPPDWWKPELYDYLPTLSLSGWTCEFFRRWALKSHYKVKPVNAMDLEFAQKNLSDLFSDGRAQYYMRGDILSQQGGWRSVLLKNDAVRVHVLHRPTPRGRAKRMKCVFTENFGNDPDKTWAEFGVDLTRRDSILFTEFKDRLADLRKHYKQPKRMNPRISDWLENKVLQVWDLRQYRVSWNRTWMILGLNSEESAHNAFNTATRLIDQNGWLDLLSVVTE